ncbi:MAG: histidine kinase, partial [Clostridia bacterium]|nr:histidine kinase [Clostridia bacterium]
MEGRSELIEKLTGIRSSKKSYYVDLKKKMAEVERRNAQLEIISQLARRINVDMSAEEIMEEVWEKLRQVVRFDRLSLYILEGDRLVLRTSVPKGQGVLGEETRVSSPHS